MSEKGGDHAKLLTYERLSELLEQQDILPSAAEVHGIVTGMIAGGAHIDKADWLVLLSDLIHEGQSFKPGSRDILQSMAEFIVHDLQDADLGFNLLLPSDRESLVERLHALIHWVQSFLVGFGVNQTHLAELSEDVREVINDLVEIAKLDFMIEEDEEAERAYFEVVEYLRISTLLCFNELGYRIDSNCGSNQTLH